MLKASSSSLLLGWIIMLPSASFAVDASMGLEYGSVSLKAKGGKSITIPSYRLNMFDTTGGLTAGIRGALNQNAAQKSKEYQIEQAAKNGTAAPEGSSVNRNGDKLYGSYTYSWEQPAPTPNDGDRWTLTTATNGTPFIDSISPPTSSEKSINSMLGIEYSSSLWSFTAAPLSFSVGWGMKFFLFSSEGPASGGIDSSSASLPIDVSLSSQVYEGIVVYGNAAITPISVFKGKGYYLHEEGGVNWNFYDGWLLTFNYRMAQDALSDKDADGDPMAYKMTSIYAGAGYQF